MISYVYMNTILIQNKTMKLFQLIYEYKIN